MVGNNCIQRKLDRNVNKLASLPLIILVPIFSHNGRHVKSILSLPTYVGNMSPLYCSVLPQTSCTSTFMLGSWYTSTTNPKLLQLHLSKWLNYFEHRFTLSCHCDVSHAYSRLLKYQPHNPFLNHYRYITSFLFSSRSSWWLLIT